MDSKVSFPYLEVPYKAFFQNYAITPNFLKFYIYNILLQMFSSLKWISALKQMSLEVGSKLLDFHPNVYNAKIKSQS
jgi:hypothetical protein